MTTPTPSAGWHPDPEGRPQLRWWDGKQWTSATKAIPNRPGPGGGPTTPTVDPAARKRGNKIAAGVLGVIVLAFVAFGIFGGDSEDDTASAAEVTTTKTPAAAETTTKSAAEVSASQAASSSRTAAAAAAAAAEAEKRRQAEAARLDPNTYETLGERDFALLAKNPDSFVGRKITVYGVVMQADAATGNKQFLARTAAEPMGASYNYDQTTLITTQDPSIIANIVEDDFVTMHVEVSGSYTYDTKIGGSNTVPEFKINIINVTG
ncbi:DUF2510 domain-containing protein (plasmid) [Rhodococcus pseudokoreensis]|uniref:DUF2510 domain-containing protein n=1 Tax=Rhodococcus pseudokoreensis TaxID=2811421 RepID=A0A974VYC7_9NOCA|nr:DUF2510 domain-containing protein [Rhodococcus pseudokoreensis]